MSKKLYKSRTDKKVSGVLGGIAQAYKFDAGLLRILFFIMLIVTSVVPMVVLYLVADWVLPFEDELNSADPTIIDLDKKE